MSSVLKKLWERAESAGFRSMASKGLLVCPSCGTKPAGIPATAGGVIKCPSCGTRASAAEWSASSVDRADALPDTVTPPEGTRITRSTDACGAAVWEIPASGNSGGLMFFAIFWCGITAMVSGGFLVTFLTGGGTRGNMPGWVLIPFFGLFWAVGLGVFYAACRGKYARHRISAAPDRVTLRRELFGKATENSLDAGSITAVSRQVFYQKNYRPVFGIEIKGARGKLRFGSALTEGEKAWLVGDMTRVMLAREQARDAATSSTVSRVRQAYFSLPVPRATSSLMPVAVILMIIGIVLAVVGMKGMKGMEHFSPPASKDGSSGNEIFDTAIGLVTGGFQGVWLLASAVLLLAGMGMLFIHLRSRGKETLLEGTDTEISIRTHRHGLVLEARTFPRTSVTDIRCSVSGSSNGKPMKRVELIVGEKAEKIAWWIDGDRADAFVAEARGALG